MKYYFVLGMDGVNGLILLTKTQFSTLDAAEKYINTVNPRFRPFVVQEIEAFPW